MDRQKLSSTLVTPSSRRYCVGVAVDGELHLSPVDAVVALRPSFDYLDRGDKKGRQEARELGEGEWGHGERHGLTEFAEFSSACVGGLRLGWFVGNADE